MKSVFQQVKHLCELYDLPDALSLLLHPLPKDKYKSICRLQVYEYWHKKLTNESLSLSSLQFLDLRYHSLSQPHPLWTTLSGNPYEVKAARIQALFLSGRYRTEKLCRYWSSNSNGFCLQKSCFNSEIVEDSKHIILHCPALNDQRRRLLEYTYSLLHNMPLLGPILEAYLFGNIDDDILMQFLLDCSVLPLVITAKQLFGDIILAKLFKMTRTWCFSLHKARLRLLGRYSN